MRPGFIGSDPVHTRVSKPSTANAPDLKNWCRIIKLLLRNSITVDSANNVWYADISGYVGMLPARFARD